MNFIKEKIQARRAAWKYSLIKNHIKDSKKILDFGAGDMSLALFISRRNKKINVTGVDVIDPGYKNKKNAKFVKYDGKKLPFKNREFDTLIAFYVLHHCNNLKEVIAECARVTGKRIIVVESIPHSKKEIPFMKFFDFIFNVIKLDKTPLPYKFKTVSNWQKMFKKNKFKLVSSYHPKNYEDFVPFGKLYILEFELG